jgi:hypothetical protein
MKNDKKVFWDWICERRWLVGAGEKTTFENITELLFAGL